MEDREVTLFALSDTGNSLTDTLSGAPVIVCEYKSVCSVIPEYMHAVYKTGNTDFLVSKSDYGGEFAQRFRIIPYNVIGSGGVLPCFKPDDIKAVKDKKDYLTNKGIVAVTDTNLSDGSYTAVFNADLIIN